MDKTYFFILESLRCYINALPPPSCDGIDLRALFKISKRQEVCGIIYSMQQSQFDFGQEKNNFAQVFAQTIQLTTRQAIAFKQFSDFCETNNIPYAPIKGAVIKSLYPNPQLRLMGDMDILIRPADLARCQEFMAENNYKFLELYDSVYEFANGAIMFELHLQLLDHNKPIFDNYLIENNQLDVTQHFIFLISHLRKHIISSGVGIRVIFDIALFERAHNLRPSDCTDALARIGACEFAAVIQNYIDKWFFSAPIAEQTFDKDELDLLEYIFQSDNFGFENRSPGVALSARRSSGAKALAIAVFPSKHTMYNLFPRLAQHKYLLPWYYIVRIFSKLKNRKYYAKVAKDALTNDGEAQRIREIHKKLGI
ncbi:MAG: nucleotidyltransferase family protein [Clostridia bacterium]